MPNQSGPVSTSTPTSKGFGSHLLVVNGGSSSLKFAVFSSVEPVERRLSGQVERIGREGTKLIVKDTAGRKIEQRAVVARDLGEAVSFVIECVAACPYIDGIALVGHRIVHGGTQFVEPQRLTPELLDGLKRISPLDPEHLPGEISVIEALTKALPGVTQVACFDTAFHCSMPKVAQLVPIPRKYWAHGIKRFGFHGISYAYLMEELSRIAGPDEPMGRIILAHLGSGASMAAVKQGHCLETTMGFTPASGLVMGTRCGDLDPGLVAFLARVEGMTPDRFHRMANQESGLLGVSETSPDLRDLLVRRETDSRAAEAVDLFCYQIKKGIGALSAVLGGLDTLIFAGGIGENSPEVRHQVCQGLEFLGVVLDDDKNRSGSPIISTNASPTKVRVIQTDEETMIARIAIRLAVASV